MKKCPICKVPLVNDSHYESSIHQTVEEYQVCKDGCSLYGYEYNYGHWQMELGSTGFTGWYRDSNTRRRKRSFIYRRRITQLRKRYKKIKGKKRKK